MKRSIQFLSRNQLELLQLLEDLSWIKSLSATKSLHAITTTIGLNPVQPTIFLHNNTLSRYVFFDNIHMANQLFDIMPQRNAVSYNIMITAFSNVGYLENALKLFSEMRHSGLNPTQFTFGALLSCNVLGTFQGLQLQGLIIKSGLMYMDAFSGTVLLGFFGRNRLLNEAVSVFDFMPIKSLVTWNSMISLFGQHGFIQDSFFMFREVMRYCIRLSESTLVGVVSSFSVEYDLLFGEQVHGVALKCGLDNVASVANCFLNMYAKCLGITKALEFFEAVTGKDIVSWNTIIAATASSHAPEIALEIFVRMDLIYPSHLQYSNSSLLNITINSHIIIMAQVSIVKKLAVVAIALAAFATASAQELAPAPSPDAGAAFSLPISGAVVGASLICSAFALLRH